MRFTRRFFIILVVLIIIIATIIILTKVKNKSIEKVQTESPNEIQSIDNKFIENSIYKEIESLSKLTNKTKVVDSRAIEMYYLDPAKINEIDVRQIR